MAVRWDRRDPEAVRAALEPGGRPDIATTMARGPLDEVRTVRGHKARRRVGGWHRRR